MNGEYSNDGYETDEGEREAAYDAHQDRMLDEEKERKSEGEKPQPTQRQIEDAIIRCGERIAREQRALGNTDNRRAKFPTRLREGESHD